MCLNKMEEKNNIQKFTKCETPSLGRCYLQCPLLHFHTAPFFFKLKKLCPTKHFQHFYRIVTDKPDVTFS